MTENKQSQTVVSAGSNADAEPDDPGAYLQLMYEQASESDGVERIRRDRTVSQ